MSWKEFCNYTIHELNLIRKAWDQGQAREDLRAGRTAAAIINFIGYSLAGKKHKGITSLDIFPEHEAPISEEMKPEMSPGAAAMQLHFKAQKLLHNQARLAEVQAKIAAARKVKGDVKKDNRNP